ncbi:hypothetical protein GW750_00105 [bacterium]|nr:hypothetical protein [bacterium]
MSNYSVSRPANHSRIIPIIPIVTNPNDSKSQLENVTVVEKNLDKAKTEAIDVKTRDNLFRDLMMAEVRGFKKVVERLTHRFASKVDSYNDYAAYANHMAE